MPYCPGTISDAILEIWIINIPLQSRLIPWSKRIASVNANGNVIATVLSQGLASSTQLLSSSSICRALQQPIRTRHISVSTVQFADTCLQYEK